MKQAGTVQTAGDGNRRSSVKELLLSAVHEHACEVSQLRAEVCRLRAQASHELQSRANAPLLTLRVAVRGVQAGFLLEERGMDQFLRRREPGRQKAGLRPVRTSRPLEPPEALALPQENGAMDPGVKALSETLQQHRVESRQMFEDMLQWLQALSLQQGLLESPRESARRELQEALASAVGGGAVPEDVEVALARAGGSEDALLVDVSVVLRAGSLEGASPSKAALGDVVVSALRSLTGSSVVSGEVVSTCIPTGSAADGGSHGSKLLAPPQVSFDGGLLSQGSRESDGNSQPSALSPEAGRERQSSGTTSSKANARYEEHNSLHSESQELREKTSAGHERRDHALGPQSASAKSMNKKASAKAMISISRTGSSLTPKGERHSWRVMTYVDRLVRRTSFEVAFLILILLNTIIMAAEAEYDGYVTAHTMGIGHSPENFWPRAPEVFKVLEIAFGCIFVVEVCLKLLVYRLRFFRSYWCDFDLMVVTLWIIEKCFAAKQMPTLVLRISRLIRALRLIRLTKTMWFADTLSLMIVALKASMSATVWSILLIFTISLCSALLMTNIARGFISGDTPLASETAQLWSPSTTTEDQREQLYLYFGTFWRSFLTILELTVGNWAPVTRMAQEYMSEWVAVAIVMYNFLMGFALLKVVQGVFLHETFRVAKSDNELMIRDKMRDTARFKHQMEDLLSEVDTDGSGMINKEEFHELFGHERVGFFLGALGLDVADRDKLWTLVMEDIGKNANTPEVSVEDLATVIGRIRGFGRSIDLVTALHNLEHIQHHLEASMPIQGHVDSRMPSRQSTPGQANSNHRASEEFDI